MKRKQFVLGSILASLAVSTCFTGCGDGLPRRVPVSGKVLIDGQPLKCGFVRFIPTGARPSGGKLDAEGRFTLACFEGDDGAVPGKHRIEVAANETLSATKVRWHAPKKYNDFATSGLEQDITEPTDSVVINLSWQGGKPFVETVATEF
jgi:hypothetical protein